MDFVMKNIYKGDKTIKISMWDTAGQEKFKSLIPSYLVGASIAVIVYDITSRQSFTRGRILYQRRELDRGTQRQG